jgi:uncharacterized protein YhbP (UPF0306 family)
MKEVPEKIIAMLRDGKFTYFCTADDLLIPHVTPMFFVYDEEDNKIYLTAASTSRKVKNLRANSQVSLTVDIRHPTDPFSNHGVMVQGVAGLSEVNGGTRAIRALAAKYPGFIRRPAGKEYLRASQDVLIEVVPRLMVHWRGPDFTRWRAEGGGGSKRSPGGESVAAAQA